MTQPASDPAAGEADETAVRKRTERLLVFIVSFLGLLIIAGLTAVVLRIIYLSSTPSAPREGQEATQEATQETPAAAALPSQDRLDLPAGAVVKSVSLSGDRLAVHYEAPSGAGIAIFDLASGAVVRRVEVSPGAGGR
ncbi:hypothetical protein [Hyphomicrobium zavarzinii]|uniref:hypothetical protein n=1 Tax=Hyphomicrobium zavarzinii TaxID=48292 RepID=UPI0012ECA6D0|nr:hypothetical protein [Hyphomicrobium zavarzinii]